MESDCQKLIESSRYIKRWINRQPSVKEESLTDWLLFDVSEKINGISYRQFTRTEEARKTGADWEWWFIFRESSFKFRVQAKKMSYDGDNWSIAYTNQHGLQIDTLLNESKNDNYIPLYAFYTSNADITMCGRKKTNNDEGVFIAGAKNIYNDFILNGKIRVNLSDAIQKTVPLSCLICCPINSNEDFEHFLRQYYPLEIISDNSNIKVAGQYKELPDYISSFIKFSKEKFPDWWEKEYSYYVKDVNALLVYEAKNEEQNNR